MRVPHLKTIVAASLLCAGVALAQGPGFGPGMGYGPGRMGGGYGALNLTDEQREKIQAIREEQRREMLRSHEETRKKIDAILTPEQRKQFRGFGPRWMG